MIDERKKRGNKKKSSKGEKKQKTAKWGSGQYLGKDHLENQ